MDHRVSKDMISSGMTPSGQRSQSDLGRTQYGSAPSPNSLMDAYHSMYTKEKEETLDEGKINPGLQAYLDKKKGKKGNGDKEEKNGKNGKGGKPDFLDLDKDGDKKESMKKASKEMKKEGVDLFDLVKGKLIDEGREEKEALKIMANMTKEEFEKVSEGLAGMALKTGLAVGGAVLAKKGLDKAKKGFDNFLNNQRNKSNIGGNKRVDDVRSGSGDSKVGEKINYGK